MHGFLSSEQLKSLLEPLSEAEPAGEYLKNNRQLYRPLRNAYNIAQTSLNKLSLNPDPSELDDLTASNQENWQQLESMLLDILQQHSRDLECMVWLAMAQMFSDRPYERLAAVILLIYQSVEAFWPQIQPWLPDDKVRSNDIEAVVRERAELQTRPLKLLFGESEDSCQMAIPLRMLPLIDDIDFTRYQREEVNRDALRQQVRTFLVNQKPEVVDLINGIQDVLDNLDLLDESLKKHFSELGMTAPGSRFLRNQLEANLAAVRDLCDNIIVPWPVDVRKSEEQSPKQEIPEAINDSENTSEAELVEITDSPSVIAGQTVHTSEQIFDRDQAFQQLRLLANYFQQTEPQSPVSYLLEKAIRWGYTPLPELMRELLQDNDHILTHITDLTGMNMTDKTPIPGQPANGLSVIPDGSVTPPPMVRTESPPTVRTERPPIDVLQQVALPDETNIDPEPAQPAPSSAGPGGLSIGNLDDLI